MRYMNAPLRLFLELTCPRADGKKANMTQHGSIDLQLCSSPVLMSNQWQHRDEVPTPDLKTTLLQTRSPTSTQAAGQATPAHTNTTAEHTSPRFLPPRQTKITTTPTTTSTRTADNLYHHTAPVRDRARSLSHSLKKPHPSIHEFYAYSPSHGGTCVSLLKGLEIRSKAVVFNLPVR